MAGKPQSNQYINPGSDSSAIILDPKAPGTISRLAFGLEAIFNIIGGTWMTLYPQHFLSLLVASSSQINASATTWTQMTGALVYALSVPLLLGLPNSRRGIESRAPTYYTLAAGELGAIAVAGYKALYEGDASGWSTGALWGVCACLAPFMFWRGYVVFVRTEWLGRYRDAGRKAD